MGGRGASPRLGGGARAFALTALLAPVLWSRDELALVGLLALTVLWTFAQVNDLRTGAPTRVPILLEAALVGAVCGLSLHTSLALVGALAVPPFTAGVHRGLRVMFLALSAELVAVVATVLAVAWGMTVEQAFGVFTWTVTGLGLGLIASFLHVTLAAASDPLQAYRNAQVLIRQLIDLSGDLSSGIDAVSLGGAILGTVGDELPTRAQALLVPRGEQLTPIATTSLGSAVDLARCEEVAADAWLEGRPVISGDAFAFPLKTQAGTIAIVGGILSGRLDRERIGLDDRVDRLMVSLEPQVVHLDTALLFSAFRDAATTEERRRLGREMHDGVAQDIASLGYLVDTMSGPDTSDEHRQELEVLRARITAVVSEVRRSVVTLRTGVGASSSLGSAIGAVARHLTEVSAVPIHLTIDERTTRLRPEVESELFRIAQEAMTNAVRHSQAKAVNVHCKVHAPDALITVRDDGLGLQQPGSTSHGLAIMRERAHLIGADLTISDPPAGGVMVSVRVPGTRKGEVAAPRRATTEATR